MENKFIMITLNPFVYSQHLTVFDGDNETTHEYSMDNIFEAALMTAETNNIENIKVGTVSFPKEYSENLIEEMKEIASMKYNNFNFNFEVI